jgi:6-phosphogluconolactonase (cycloisomerase 2 family)
MAVFDRVGRVVSADHGTGRLSVLSATDDGLTACARCTTERDSSPRHIAFGLDGRALYVAHKDALECYGYDPAAGRILGLRQRLSDAGVADGSNVLAVHPSGRFLFACDEKSGIAVWRIEASTGVLEHVGRNADEMGRLHAFEISHDGVSLIAFSRESGTVWGATIDAAKGLAGKTRLLARIDSPSSIQMIYS